LGILTFKEVIMAAVDIAEGFANWGVRATCVKQSGDWQTVPLNEEMADGLVAALKAEGMDYLDKVGPPASFHGVKKFKTMEKPGFRAELDWQVRESGGRTLRFQLGTQKPKKRLRGPRPRPKGAPAGTSAATDMPAAPAAEMSMSKKTSQHQCMGSCLPWNSPVYATGGQLARSADVSRMASAQAVDRRHATVHQRRLSRRAFQGRGCAPEPLAARPASRPGP